MSTTLALTDLERETLDLIVRLNLTSLGENLRATADGMDEAIREAQVYADLLRAAESGELPLPLNPIAALRIESWRDALPREIAYERNGLAKRRAGDPDYGWSDDLEADESQYAEHIENLERELEGCDSILNRAQAAPVPA
ncbi:MAG: hypothetical protein ACR2KV_14060 [Solirubrobacteraceae bacterium]